MNLRRRGQNCGGQNITDEIGSEMRPVENLQCAKGELIFCYWHGVWWPGHVVEVRDKSTYIVGFWNEDDCITREAQDLCSFDSELPVVATSLRKLKNNKYLLKKYKVDIEITKQRQAKHVSDSSITEAKKKDLSNIESCELSTSIVPTTSASCELSTTSASCELPTTLASCELPSNLLSTTSASCELSTTSASYELSTTSASCELSTTSASCELHNDLLSTTSASCELSTTLASCELPSNLLSTTSASCELSTTSESCELHNDLLSTTLESCELHNDLLSTTAASCELSTTSASCELHNDLLSTTSASCELSTTSASCELSTTSASCELHNDLLSTTSASCELSTTSASCELPTTSASCELPTTSASCELHTDLLSTTSASCELSTTSASCELPSYLLSTTSASCELHTNLLSTTSESCELSTTSASCELPTTSASCELPTTSASCELHTDLLSTTSASCELSTTSASCELPSYLLSTTSASCELHTNLLSTTSASCELPTTSASCELSTTSASCELPTNIVPTTLMSCELPSSSVSCKQPSKLDVHGYHSSSKFSSSPDFVSVKDSNGENYLFKGEFGMKDGMTTFLPTAVVAPNPTLSPYMYSDNQTADNLECVMDSDQSFEMSDESTVDNYSVSEYSPYSSDSSEDDEMIEESKSNVTLKRGIASTSRLKVKRLKVEKGSEIVEDSDSDLSDIIPNVPCFGPLSLNTEPHDSSEQEDESDLDEDEIVRDEDCSSIFVKKIRHSSTSKNGKAKRSDRVYNTRNCCPFCKKLCSSFAQHVMSKHHRNEPLVKQLLCAKGKDKKLLLTDLRNKGNNQHNEDVLKAKKGELLLSRRCNEKKFSVSNYGPCPNCLSWILLANIHRHKCTTSKKSASVHVSKGNLLIQSAVLAGRVTGEADQTLVREVFPIMKDDKVGVLARQDRLIVGLGNQWMRRNVGNKLMRKYYASAVMRLASRLLIQLNSMVTPASGKDLESYIHPMYFTEIAKAALKVARQDEDDEEKIEAPSNAIKLAYDLKRMGNLKLANAIKQCDYIKKSEAKDFLKLMQLEWTTKLSRVALEERKHLKNKPLPLPEDVQKLAVYLRSEMENFNIEDTSYENFRNGVILAEAGLITYNRRRPGEIQALSLMAYENRKTGIDEVSEEIAHNLSSFEKKLVESQDVIEIRGKCGKYVPVIVPSHIRRILKYLADPGIRRSVGIPSKPYIFATNRGGVVRGYDAIISVTEKAGLTNPERIRGTNMRRLMATLTQAIDITPQQQQWVVDHLGHTLDVHRIHYKCTSDVIERVDIAKLLLLLDNRMVGKFKGKKLEEIQLDELLENSGDLGEIGGDAEKASLDQTEDSREDEDEDFIPDLLEQIEEPTKSKPDKRKAPTLNRHKWTFKELEELKDVFKEFFRKDKTPGQKHIEDGKKTSQKRGGLIWRLDTSKIKKKISWLRLHPAD